MAINDWETYLRGLTPCRFPKFSRSAHDAAEPPQHQTSSTRVNVEQAEKLLALSTTDPDGLGAALRTAWALLLRCYTGQDDVNFEFQHSGNVAGDPIVARFLLDDAESIARTVDRAKAELTGDLSAVPPQLLRTGDSDLSFFDTAVVLWTLTARSTPCPVLTPVWIPSRSHTPHNPWPSPGQGRDPHVPANTPEHWRHPNPISYQPLSVLSVE
jgi:hypothetical protein